MSLEAIAGATIGFAVFSAAHLAENFRAACKRSPRPVRGLRRGRAHHRGIAHLFIVLPQALRVSIPPLVGQVISTFKETSLLAIVGIFDFLRIANSVISAQSESSASSARVFCSCR